MNQKNRLRKLDFLRGIAIILVLLRHQYLFKYGYTMGWIGVDLFFVLSGFLVSGLLFKEYIQFGNINVKLFLIRRGFKIYPIYYLIYPLYLIPLFFKNQIDFEGIFADLFFIQNYVKGWGYAYVASWSLAVEEHFYILFSIILWLVIKFKLFHSKENLERVGTIQIKIFFFFSFVVCLVLRVYSNLYHPDLIAKNFVMTHLRIDSLLAGVFIAYLYYFEEKKTKSFFLNYKKKFLFTVILLLGFTPFLDPDKSFFVRTFGLTLLYVAFSIVLCYFLFEEKIDSILNSFFSEKIVSLVAMIGVSSYSIYIIHTLVNIAVSYCNVYVFDKQLHQIFIFFLSTIASCLGGILMTKYLESYFLNLREQYFPSRSKQYNKKIL